MLETHCFQLISSVFDNWLLLSNENGSTGRLAGSYYVDLKEKQNKTKQKKSRQKKKKKPRRKPISFKFANHGRKVIGTFRCRQTKPEINICRQTKPEINILFAVCRVLN